MIHVIEKYITATIVRHSIDRNVLPFTIRYDVMTSPTKNVDASDVSLMIMMNSLPRAGRMFGKVERRLKAGD